MSFVPDVILLLEWNTVAGVRKTFVKYRHLAELPLAATYLDLKKQIEDIRQEMNDILSDQNDINESTRAQLDAISTALAELQSSRSQNATLKPRKPIGFIQPEDEEGWTSCLVPLCVATHGTCPRELLSSHLQGLQSFYIWQFDIKIQAHKGPELLLIIVIF